MDINSNFGVRLSIVQVLEVRMSMQLACASLLHTSTTCTRNVLLLYRIETKFVFTITAFRVTNCSRDRRKRLSVTAINSSKILCLMIVYVCLVLYGFVLGLILLV